MGDKAKPRDHVQHESQVSEIIVIRDPYTSSTSHTHIYRYHYKGAATVPVKWVSLQQGGAQLPWPQIHTQRASQGVHEWFSFPMIKPILYPLSTCQTHAGSFVPKQPSYQTCCRGLREESVLWSERAGETEAAFGWSTTISVGLSWVAWARHERCYF